MQTFFNYFLLPTLSNSYDINSLSWKKYMVSYLEIQKPVVYLLNQTQKMKRDNTFLDIAEKISDINNNRPYPLSVFICNELLKRGSVIRMLWFKDTFKPTIYESEVYFMCEEAWLSSYSYSSEYNNNEFRILVCCMADILWNEHLQNGH